MSIQSHKPYRSFFWPVILLGAGVIWLLTNLGMIPTENLWILVQLWPVLIIVAGLDIIFARRLPLVGALLALAVIGGVVLVLLEGIDLGQAERPEPQMETFVISAEETAMAYLKLNLATQPTTIRVLDDPENLLEAEIGHFGDVEMRVEGGEEKEIVLEQQGVVSWFAWLLQEVQDEELTWDVQLNPGVPFDLEVDGGTGRVDMHLDEVQMGRFRFDGGTGTAEIILPASQQSYVALVEPGTGNVNLVLPAEGNLTLRLNGSIARILVDVPEGAALQVEVQRGGTGDVIRPDWLQKVKGLEDRDEGVYQTEGFDSAEYQLVVIVEDLSTGNLVIE